MRSSVRFTTPLLLLLLAGAAWAQDRPSVELRYGEDVGFFKGAEDALPIGPDYLAAGPNRTAALYDPVRREVVVFDPTGVKTRIKQRHVDGLALGDGGQILVFSGRRGRVRVFEPSGELRKEHKLPRRTAAGDRAVLEAGIAWSVAADGSRTELGRLVDGRLQPPTREGVIAPGDRRTGGRDRIRIGDEEIVEPGAVRLTGRRIGGEPAWYDVQGVTRGRGGAVRVKRFAVQAGRGRVELPTGKGSYTPSFDLATSPSGALVFLDPRAQGLRIVWVDSP